MKEIRTRIAPSPTGMMHLGTARTAIYCWAVARHFGGKFLLRIEDTDQVRSTKEAVQAVAQAIAEAAPVEMDTPMLTPMVKRAMSKSIEEKGVIDVKDVAEEVFRSDPEREAIIEQVARQIQEEQLEPVIPVENKRVVAQLQRVKIKTDNGISITLPRELADDENSFAVVENGDGTISIIINKVQELKTE